MFHKIILFLFLQICLSTNFQILNAQETFSIIAVDTVTGEIGSAGASCLELFNLPYDTDLIADVIPGIGAINTQSYFIAANQINARTRLLAGDSAQQIINWLFNNDVEDNPSVRQYGVISLINGRTQVASFTGDNCFDYKGQRIGKNYSIQGNILIGPEVLDKMEEEFLKAKGNLPCRLMASLQGANFPGADSRCIQNGTSALFAFLKVANPNDDYKKPTIKIGVKTKSNSKIEPIDSLQKILNELNLNCLPISNKNIDKFSGNIKVFPNPFCESFTVEAPEIKFSPLEIVLRDLLGKQVSLEYVSNDGNVTCITHNLPSGFYSLLIRSGNFFTLNKIIKK